MKKIVSFLLMAMILISNISYGFANEEQYYMGPFSRTPEELEDSSNRSTLGTLEEVENSINRSRMTRTPSWTDDSLVLSYDVNDGGLIVNSLKQGTSAYDELMENGYTDLNYSFWGTWNWMGDNFCSKTAEYLNKGDSIASTVNNVSQLMAPTLLMFGVAAAPAEATALASDIVSHICAAMVLDIENNNDGMGIALKTTITGVLTGSVHPQRVAKIY